MRACKTCGVEKPLDEFYAHSRYKDGRKPSCKKCEIASQVEYQRRPEVRDRKNQWARENRVRTPEDARRQRLWTWHRMTVERFDALLKAQGGKCAIAACPATEPGGKGEWHVDHDHSCCPTPRSCGKCVRGLLCSRCNPMLGMARDDVAILLSACDYLNNAALSAIGAIGG